MPHLRHNVAANFLGQAWVALVVVLCMPIYARMFGLEAYGLIGVYISLQALVFSLDAGLSVTLNRELARSRVASPAVSADIVRTLEWAFLPICLAVAAMSFAGGHWVANWVRPVGLTEMEVAGHAALMLLAVAALWPSTFYTGGLSGLERQVSSNIVGSVFATSRWVVVIPVVAIVGGGLQTFFLWQVGNALLQSLVTRAVLIRALGPRQNRRPAFRMPLLRQAKPFAFGMFAIGALSFITIQADRLVLSHVLPLDAFGRYALVAMAASMLARVHTPFFAALFPRYSGLIATGKIETAIALYHRSNQILAVVLAAASSVLIVFAEDILLLWTHDPQIAGPGAIVLQLLVIGTACNGLLNLPYAMQLAHGWTRLALWQNVVGVVLILPSAWFFAQWFGAPGAAACWAALGVASLLIGIPLMHRRILRQEMRSWWLGDIAPPVIAAALSASLFRWLVPVVPDSLAGLALLATASLFVLLAAAFAAPQVRQTIINHLRS